MLAAAIADPCTLLIGVSLRHDTINTSERGAKLQLPVAVLTLQYREGAEVGRVTLQMLLDMAEQLRRSFEEVLG